MSGKMHSMDDVVNFVDQFAKEKPQHASKAMFYFLYKEILVTRIMALETDAVANRGAIEHNEKLINDLNQKLMDELEK